MLLSDADAIRCRSGQVLPSEEYSRSISSVPQVLPSSSWNPSFARSSSGESESRGELLSLCECFLFSIGLSSIIESKSNRAELRLLLEAERGTMRDILGTANERIERGAFLTDVAGNRNTSPGYRASTCRVLYFPIPVTIKITIASIDDHLALVRSCIGITVCHRHSRVSQHRVWQGQISSQGYFVKPKAQPQIKRFRVRFSGSAWVDG